MANLSMYLTKQDLVELNDWLNNETDIAFLVSNGDKSWIAKNEYNILEDIENQLSKMSTYETVQSFIEFELWHIPSGPLPYLDVNKNKLSRIWNKNPDGIITDPWKGWTEIRSGVNSNVPYFGAGHPGVISLKVRLSEQEEIPQSEFGWIGNHYKAAGFPAHESTEKYWLKLRKMAKKHATQIPKGNLSGNNEVYAFPKAHKEINNGRPCSLN